MGIKSLSNLHTKKGQGRRVNGGRDVARRTTAGCRARSLPRGGVELRILKRDRGHSVCPQWGFQRRTSATIGRILPACPPRPGRGGGEFEAMNRQRRREAALSKKEKDSLFWN